MTRPTHTPPRLRLLQQALALPYAFMRDVLERLPTQPASRIEELLPHRWHAT